MKELGEHGEIPDQETPELEYYNRMKRRFVEKEAVRDRGTDGSDITEHPPKDVEVLVDDLIKAKHQDTEGNFLSRALFEGLQGMEHKLQNGVDALGRVADQSLETASDGVAKTLEVAGKKLDDATAKPAGPKDLPPEASPERVEAPPVRPMDEIPSEEDSPEDLLETDDEAKDTTDAEDFEDQEHQLADLPDAQMLLLDSHPEVQNNPSDQTEIKSQKMSDTPEKKSDAYEFIFEYIERNPLRRKWWESQSQIFQDDILLDNDYTDIIKYEIGFWVPLKSIEDGTAKDFIFRSGEFEHYTIKNPEISPLLKNLQILLEFKTGEFTNLIGINQSDFYKLLQNKAAMNLNNFIHLSENSLIHEKLTSKQFDKLNRSINQIIFNKNTKISSKGRKVKLNWKPDNLERILVNNRYYVLLPKSKWEVKENREAVKDFVEHFATKKGIFPTFLEIQDKFSGAFYRHLAEYGLTHNIFIESLKIEPKPMDKEQDHSKTSQITNELEQKMEVATLPNELSEPLQNFLEITPPEYRFGIWIPSEIFDSGDLAGLLKNTNAFKSCLIINPELGPYLQELRNKFQFTRRKFSQILSIDGNQMNPATYYRLSRNQKGFSLPRLLKLPEHPIIRKNLTAEEILNFKKKINSILKSDKTSIYRRQLGAKGEFNLHFDNLEKVKLGNREYVIIPTNKWELKEIRDKIHHFALEFFIKNGRAPRIKDLKKLFGRGIYNFIDHNKLLENLDLPLNVARNYDWSNEETWKEVREWIDNFYSLTYIFEGKGRSPMRGEVEIAFNASMFNYLYDKGLPGSKSDQKFSSHNDLLEFWGFPKIDLDQIREQGLDFDKKGQEKCLGILYENVYSNIRVFHPLIEGHWVIPDGINQNLEINPIKFKDKNFYMEVGQKLEKIIEFKRSFGSMTPKDWNLYTMLAKTMDVYLLTGKKVKTYEINGCKIIYHTRKDLYAMLRKKITPKNQAEIESLISEIELIVRGDSFRDQKDLLTYLTPH